MYLLTYTGNWNDEISVDGFIIINNEVKKKIIKLLKNYDENIYISNDDDDIEYDNGKDLLDEISFDQINKDEELTIKKYFGDFNDFGYNLLLNLDKISDNINLI